MSQSRDIRQARRDAQSIEIALALLSGIAVFLGLVVPVVLFAHVLGLADGSGWAPFGQIGVVLAAAAGLASTVRVLVRAHGNGI